MPDNPIAAALAKSGWGTQTKKPKNGNGKKRKSPKAETPIDNPPVLPESSIAHDEPEQSETYQELQKAKLRADTRYKEIQSEKELNNLIERPLMKSIIAQISQEIQTTFVDFPKREATELAAKLGLPDKDREVEIFLAEKIEIALDAVVAAIDRFIDDRVYEK